MWFMAGSHSNDLCYASKPRQSPVNRYRISLHFRITIVARMSHPTIVDIKFSRFNILNI